MARLADDSQKDVTVDSAEILSPKPFVPSGNGFLVSSLESSNDTYRPENAQRSSGQDYEYNSSSSSTRHSTSDIFGHEMDEELEQLKSRASSRSSLSSVPASVLIHPVDGMKQMPDMDVHEKIAGYRIEASEASFGDFNDIPTNIRTIRQREAAFRKPSSVRAMQMHTEDEADDDDYLTPPRKRQGHRSPGSSPLKRSPYYSPNTSKQPKPKKEAAPLVLLHCTLLPPSLPVPGAADPRNQDILEDELPPEYWRRWRRLQDRVGSGVLRDRGVLISHPEDLYDMLEERLLESLELQRPRLQNGHFVGHDDHSSGSGSEGDFSDIGESETDGEQGDQCPDCGNHVRHSDSNRKWEIRVFAANGLMRAGAWAAAWRDMEKVDVEVGVWLPSDVRRALERRLAESQMAVAERGQGQTSQMHMDMQMSLADRENQVPPEILQSPRQSHARMISDGGSFRSEGILFRQSFSGADGKARLDHVPDFGQETKEHEVALSTLLVNYIRVLATDRRNIALVLLSTLVAFLAFGSRQQQVFLYSDLGSLPQSMAHEKLASAMPSLSMIPSLSPSASPANSAAATDRPELGSVESLPIFKPPTEDEKLAVSTAATEPGSSSSPLESFAASTDSMKLIEATLPSQILETTQPRKEEFAPIIESLDVPKENLQSTETMQLQPEGTADVSLADYMDSPAVSMVANPSSIEYIEAPTLSNAYKETEPSQPNSATNLPVMESTESAPPYSELPPSSASASVVSKEPFESVLVPPPQLESTVEPSLAGTMDLLVASAESAFSPADYTSPATLLEVCTATSSSQSNTWEEKQQ